MKFVYANILTGLLLSLLIAGCAGKSTSGESETPSSGNAALDAVNLKIKNNPGDAALYAERARFFFENSNYDGALEDLQKAILMDSMQPPFYFLLTDVYMQYFKSWHALRAIQKAADLFPNDIPTLLKLCRTQVTLQRYEEAMRTLDRILTIDPQNAEAHMLFGFNFKELGDTARAINSFQKAVNFNSDLLDAWINLGQLHESKGHIVAEKYFNAAIEVAPENITAYHAKADFLSRQDDLNGALEVYRQILAINPEYKEAYYNSGLLYLDLDSIAEARNQFDLLIKASPLHIRGYYYRGYCAELAGNKEEAIADYQKALRFAPDYRLAKEGLIRLGAPAQ